MISHEYRTPIKEKLRDLESRYIHEEFAQILDIPCEGACVFTDRCRLDELAYGIPSDGPYQTNLPSIEDIISSIRINRDGQVRRIRHEEEIDVLEYTSNSMRMEQYLTHTDYALWEVIVNGDAPTAISPASAGTKGHIPPKTNEQKLARKNELKAKITLLLAIPDEYLLKFHGIKDAKTLWEAIKARFKTGEEFHVVSPSYTGNYMPSRPDLSFAGLDDYVYKTKLARSHSPRETSSISIARPVNIAAPKPKVNDALHITYSYFKAHSPVRRAFNQKSAAKTNNVNEKVNTARVNNVTTDGPKVVVSAIEGNKENAGNPQYTLQDQGIFDSGCFRHMTGNKSFLIDYQEMDGGFVAFGGSPKGGKITRKGKIRTGKLDFEDVYFVKELKFNLFSVSQMCDKKNSVLFTKTECLVLSPDFKLLDESQVLLKVPRHDNMYSFDLKSVVPSGGLTCLFGNATIDESNLWHRRLGHINFKTMNKFVRGNLVRGLPSKIFENDHTCVACQKGKQHKASCKTKLVSSICQPLQMLHMGLFGPTSIRSINHKIYCIVITDDFSRFSWVFFLATKDETSGILKTFITGIENQINHKVKIIRCDNRTKFKNNNINQFCRMKGIKREFSVAKTPQQNEVAERKNRTLIEAARTILADSLLPTTFWAEAVNTACYV
ncbi:putative ribonuclease H-like domain-containing protein [Tanacetum coccineum]